MHLTAEQVRDYSRDGYLTGLRIAEDVEAARYRRLFDELEEQEGRDKCHIGLLDRHVDQQFIRQLATHPGILDCVESLIGPNILLLATHFFCKYGKEDRFVAWHQDVTYWGLEPPLAITAWYAIDDSDCENGCMRVIPGTHRSGVRQHGKSGKQGNLLSINQEVSVTAAEEQTAVDLQLRAGEISLHDGLLIHGSLPNLSDRRRCGLTLRYIPAHVRQTQSNSVGKTWNTVPVRGENTQGDLPLPTETSVTAD